MSRKINVFLDIETIPTQSEVITDYIQSNMKAPTNYKKPEAISAWIDDNKDVAYRKTALNGGFGQVVCIGYAINDEQVNTIYFDDWANKEAEILQTFFNHLTARYRPSSDISPIFIGHNIEKFDLKFIHQRSIVLGIKPPSFLPLNSKTYNNLYLYDTMTEWGGRYDYTSLNDVCMALGIPPKDDDIDGSKVWDYVKSGDIKKVAEYCADDVDKTRAIFNKMNYLS